MHFQEFFVTTAGQSGLLAVITEYILVVTIFSFFGMTIFSLATKNAVAPEHRSSSVMTAVICFVAGLSYVLIRTYFHAMLETLSKAPTPVDRHNIIYAGYLAIGQFRYMDWTVTTPLLLLKNVLLLRVKPRQIPGTLTVLIVADLLMIFTGYIGEQAVNRDYLMLEGPHYFWGFVSTIFYAIIVYILWRVYQQFAAQSEPEERLAYRWLGLATVTTWGVYPLGYMVPTLFPHADLNWIHVAFSVADVVNKAGLGIVAYLAGARLLDKAVSKDVVVGARSVG